MSFTPDDPFPKKQGDAIRSKDWNDAIGEVRRLDMIVPVGTIIQWWRPIAAVPIPPGFEVCDGRTLSADQHDFRLPGGARLNQSIKLPDLRNCFVLGANSAAADGTPAVAGDQPLQAPGINGQGGSNSARSIDHRHSVTLNHQHGPMTTLNDSVGRTESVALGTDASGDHGHHVSTNGVHIAWIDEPNPQYPDGGRIFPSLAEPIDQWMPMLPEHDTASAGNHAHSISAHAHSMTHTHPMNPFDYVGSTRSSALEDTDPKSVDVLARHVGLLFMMRVR